jgi:hypothetical protein
MKIINDTAPAIETALATRTAGDWRPILVTTATVNTAVQVFIVLEKATQNNSSQLSR